MFTKKLKTIPSLLLAIMAIIISAQAIGLVFLFSAPENALAQSMNLQVPIGNFDKVTFTNDTSPIAAYVKAIYTYGVGAVGILAAVVLMIGGMMWITAGGNTGRVTEAKDLIFASLTGLVLVLTSYLLLSQVNPALVKLGQNVTTIKSIDGQSLEKVTDTGCKATDLTKTEGSTCASINESGWLPKEDRKFCPDYKTGNACCCPPRAKGCPDDYTITCQACDDCQNISSDELTFSNISCKHSESCSVTQSMIDKLDTLNDTLKAAGAAVQITEAWPPTAPHISKGHQDGTCIDLTETFKNTKKEYIEPIYSALKESGFSVSFECFPKDSCSCGTYDSSIVTKCGVTETGKNAGEKNHFHVCN